MLTRHFATSKTPTQLPTTQDFTYNLLCLQWLARISAYALENKEFRGWGGGGYAALL